MIEYARPKIPIAPVLSQIFRLFFYKKDLHGSPSLLDANDRILTTSGRMAIALALKHAGIGKNDKVLIPSFHCSSMVEPVIWSEATPVFYQIQKDTNLDLSDVIKKLDKNVKMIMITHFFGFHQDMKKIKALCDKENILILEDCAHAFFGKIAGKSVGSWGDYAIGSSMKFFPIYDGGCLVSNNKDLSDIKQTSAGKSFEVKTALNTLENSFEYSRLKTLSFFIRPVFKIKDYLWKLMKNRAGDSSSLGIGPGASEGGFEFEASWVRKKMSIISQFIFLKYPKQLAVNRRIKNYHYLNKELSSIKSFHPLFSTLPQGVVPYVYPVYVDNPQPIFHQLKLKQIPIIRFGEFLWDGVDESVCPVSVEYSQHIFQFPCHQEFTQSELEWMVNEIKKTCENINN